MNPLYLRREPTLDTTLIKYAPKARKGDVVAYLDPEATEPHMRWSWYMADIPTRRNKRVTVNCATRPVIWLPELA
jgi:hypothetical protein